MENFTKETFRERYLKKVREMVKAEGEKRDLFLSQIVETIGDLEKTINQLGMRLKEWYSYYFPELEVNEIEKFARIVLEIDDKKKVSVEKLRTVLGEGKAEKIKEMANRSAGGEIKGEDLIYIKRLAKQISDMNDLKTYYEEQIEKISNEIAPNATYIAGGKIVAKLISHAKGLEKIANMPASTIQVLGAEKALFKYLKKQARRPPKHGILLLHNYVNSLPRHVRGKMARTFAAKLSIAFKADNGKCGFIAKPIKALLDKRYEELKNVRITSKQRENERDNIENEEGRSSNWQENKERFQRPERNDRRENYGNFERRSNYKSFEKNNQNRSFDRRPSFGSFNKRDDRNREGRENFRSEERRSFSSRDNRNKNNRKSFGSGGKRKDRGGGSRRPNSGRGKRRY